MEPFPETTRPTQVGELVARVTRELTKADRAALDQSPTTALKRISSRHHALARCVARGLKIWECAAITGYAPGTVSVLMGDSTFKELVESYRVKDDFVIMSLAEKLMGVAHDAVDELANRLESDPSLLTVPQIMNVLQLAADRSGHGPSSTSNVNHTVGIAERLQAARERAAQRQLDLKAKEITDAA